MTLMRIAGLSILLGAAAAALIWFGWGLVENLLALRRASQTASQEEDADNAGNSGAGEDETA